MNEYLMGSCVYVKQNSPMTLIINSHDTAICKLYGLLKEIFCE